MDTLTAQARSERMARVRNKDTKPELAVRRMVRALGFGYRLHHGNLPGRPDLVFPGRKKAIFVHGCFWHRHESVPPCPLARLPKSRLDFWLPKLEGNRLRDQEKQRKLMEQGWTYLVIWECELKRQAMLEDRIKSFLGEKA